MFIQPPSTPGQRSNSSSNIDPPYGHRVNTKAGDMWQVPAKSLRRKIFGRWCVEYKGQKISILLQWQQTGFFQLWSKSVRTSRATSRPLDYGSTCYFRGHLYSLALPDTKRVDRGFILCRNRRCIVGWCVENRRRISIPLL